MIGQAAMRRALEFQGWSAYRSGALSFSAYAELVERVLSAELPVPDLEHIEGGAPLFALSQGEDPDRQTAIERPTPAQIRCAREHFRHQQDQAARLIEVTGRTWRRMETGGSPMRPEQYDRYVLSALLERDRLLWPYRDLTDGS